ncbi:acetyl-CoA carboxylase biotin carboxyl carrier protein subunit [Bacteroidales bacterium OttesenSCG-928-I21]|nr:acetyl-CoA carboxylase biotin carboxyl carrier protein subunit [Bacteroidales bacterium OttesenSCG-928-I21]
MNENKKIVITIDDSNYTSFSTPAYEKKAKWKKPDDRNITAIIPGTVTEIFVKEGDKVIAGDNMLVIEAMKMNNQILFEKTGIVDKVLVKKGEIVSKGQVIVVLK